MKTVKVAAAVIVDGGKIFATQRGYGAYKDGWEFPGGKIEKGESGEEAVIREIREELTADICVTSFLCTSEYDYPEFHISMDCFVCRIAGGDLRLLEHEDARWLSAEKLDTVNWLPADRQIIGKVKEILKDA